MSTNRFCWRHTPQPWHALVPRRWVFLAPLLIACGDAGDRHGAAPSTNLPTLVESPLPFDQRAASSELATVVVGDRGEVLLVDPDTEGGSLILLGDGPVRHYGSRGEGPGEMRMAQPLLVDDSLVMAFDLSSRRVMIYDRVSTAIRREVRPSQPVIPILRGHGNTLIASRFERGIESPAVVDLLSGRTRSVLSPADSFRIQLFAGDEAMPGGSVNTSVLGRWAGGVLLGNGMTYRIGLYGADGELRHRIERDLAPRRLTETEIELQMSRLQQSPMARSPDRLKRIRQQLEALPVRWFTHRGPPRDDGNGRLWVLLQHGDSTSADLYAGDRQLGHLRIDCPGFGGQWDVSGEWLVLLCFPADPDAISDAEVRRWRIVD